MKSDGTIESIEVGVRQAIHIADLLRIQITRELAQQQEADTSTPVIGVDHHRSQHRRVIFNAESDASQNGIIRSDKEQVFVPGTPLPAVPFIKGIHEGACFRAIDKSYLQHSRGMLAHLGLG